MGSSQFTTKTSRISHKVFFQDYAKAGANLMTFHLEAVNGPDEAVDLVQAIGVAGMEAGVAIKPGTKVDLLLEVMRMCKTKDTHGKV